MEQWIELRRKIRNQEVPLRELSRDTVLHTQELRRFLGNIVSEIIKTFFII